MGTPASENTKASYKQALNYLKISLENVNSSTIYLKKMSKL